MPADSVKMKSGAEDGKISFHKVLKLLSTEQKPILIYNEPGMGKSTEMTMISIRLKKKFPDHYIVFMDLQKHCSEYDKNGKVSMMFDSAKEICIFFCEKILKLQIFQRQIFSDLFNENRVIFLIDAFDEISPSYNDFIVNLLKGLNKQSSNKIFIATRPHFTKLLENKIDVLKLRLELLIGIKKKEFLNKHIKFLDKNIEEEVISEKVSEILNLVKNLGGSFSSPQLLYMMAKLSVENTEELTKNMFSLYKKFIDTLNKRTLKKGTEAESSVSNIMGNSEITDFYQQLALEKLEFQEKCETSIKLSVDDILRVGIVFLNENGEFDFTHRTYAEFYIAKLVFESIFEGKKSQLEKTTEIFKKILKESEKHSIILTFIDSAIEQNLTVIEKLPSKCKENVKQFFNPPSYSIPAMNKHSCTNLIHLILHTFVSNANMDAKKAWLKHSLTNKIKLAKNNMIYSMGYHQKKLWSIDLKYLGEKHIKDVFEKEKLFLRFSEMGRTNLIEFFLNETLWSTEEKIRLIMGQSKNGENILTSSSDFKSVYKVLYPKYLNASQVDDLISYPKRDSQ